MGRWGSVVTLVDLLVASTQIAVMQKIGTPDFGSLRTIVSVSFKMIKVQVIQRHHTGWMCRPWTTRRFGRCP